MTTSSVLSAISPAKKPRDKRWSVEIAVCVTLLAAISFRAFKSVTALEICAAALFLVLVSWAWKHQDLRRFLVLIVLWLASIAVSDQIHNVGVGATVGSLALPVLLGLSTLMLGWIARGSRSRLRAVAIGASLSHVIFMAANGTTYFEVNPWKYGLALPVTLLALVLVAGFTRATTGLSIAVLAASGIYSFFNDFRSMAGLALAAIIIMLVLRRPPKPSRKHRMIKLFLGLLVVVYASYGAYALAASAGLLPSEATAKYQAQIQQGNLLIAARPEVVGSLHAVVSSPLFGLGTGGELDQDSMSSALNMLYSSGATIGIEQQARLFGQGVNSHSLLFSGWTASGVLGALPWAFLIYLGMRAIAYRQPGGEILPLTVFWALASSWDILFSPYQPHAHILLAAFVVLVTWKQADDLHSDPDLPAQQTRTEREGGRPTYTKNAPPFTAGESNSGCRSAGRST
jgi:hypothetical protein